MLYNDFVRHHVLRVTVDVHCLHQEEASFNVYAYAI